MPEVRVPNTTSTASQWCVTGQARTLIFLNRQLTICCTEAQVAQVLYEESQVAYEADDPLSGSIFKKQTQFQYKF